MINGISTQKYEDAALSVPETFGIKRDSVSRRWIRASAKKLAALNDRSLTEQKRAVRRILENLPYTFDMSGVGLRGRHCPRALALRRRLHAIGFFRQGCSCKKWWFFLAIVKKIAGLVNQT